MAAVVTVDLPQDIFKFSTGHFTLDPMRALSQSQFAPSLPRFGTTREFLWGFDVASPALSREVARKMHAWFARLAGLDWAFTAYDPYQKLPEGAGNGFSEDGDEILFTTSPGGQDLSFCSDLSILEGGMSALVKTQAARGATTMLVKGLDTSLSGQAVLKAGDHFAVGLPGEMNLHMAVADSVCDANGDARIDFLAPLWKRALVNDLVQFARPTGRFLLFVAEPGAGVRLVRNANDFASGNLRAIEYPYQEPQA